LADIKGIESAAVSKAVADPRVDRMRRFVGDGNERPRLLLLTWRTGREDFGEQFSIAAALRADWIDGIPARSEDRSRWKVSANKPASANSSASTSRGPNDFAEVTAKTPSRRKDEG
jgi:hypothetical protein